MKVPVLSFGASSLGSVFHETREAESIKAVFTAIENGMNFIDVSPYYGHYKAETVLGKALKDIPRDHFLLSTKVGRYGKDGVNTWDYSARRATESVYESMERLHLDYVDLINVHDIEFADLNQVVNETLPALVELRDKGIVKHVGITDLQLENLQWIIDRVPEGTVETDWHHQRLPPFDGIAVTTGRSRLASGTGGIGRSLPESSTTLHFERLSDRKAGHAIFRKQPADSDHPIQFRQSGKCQEEYPIHRRTHRLEAGARSTGNHRRPETGQLVQFLNRKRNNL